MSTISKRNVFMMALLAASLATASLEGRQHNGGGRNDCRMTGGGSIFDPAGAYTGRTTHGFELHCDLREPNNLEINWGPGNRFHLTDLTTANCPDDPTIAPDPPPAGFDTFIGTGVGRFNGAPGYCIAFTLTDAGEPGVDDNADFLITDCAGTTILDVGNELTFGNHQAHGR